MPKNLNYSILLDYYGVLLTEKQRETLEYYYNDDLSLSEISEIVGTTRQGVMDIIKRSEQQLNSLDNKLCLKDKFHSVDSAAEIIASVIDEVTDSNIKFKLQKALDKLTY